METCKYKEDEILREVEKYIESTYSKHYVSKNDTQLFDLFDDRSEVAGFCRINAMKYLARFGKKAGKNKQDLLKAIHYTILLHNFTDSND
jgi:hypothetical protein